MRGLYGCAGCGHLRRDMAGVATGARGHPWGGNSGFDRVRLALTMRRIAGLFLGGGATPSVLDIGFGSGALLRQFLERGCRIAGVEKGMLDVGVDARVREEGRLFWGGIEDTAIPEGEFDLVVGIHLIEHVEDVRAFAAACLRALRPGGGLYLLTPNAASAGLSLFGGAWWNLEDPSHVRFFSAGSLRRLLESEGFGEVRAAAPAWDSVMVEINSLWRWLGLGAGRHGVLSRGWVRAMDIALLPISLGARVMYPRLASSLEVVARKGGGP